MLILHDLVDQANLQRSHWRKGIAGQQQFVCCERHFAPAHNARCYCARNLYATIRATMLAKISSAGRDFRIIGIVEWRAADRPG